MRWTEFRDLLSGLGPESALMRVVSIRAEEDKDVLKHFTPEQRRIRSQWRNRAAKQKPKGEVDSFLRQMQKTFAALYKEGESK